MSSLSLSSTNSYQSVTFSTEGPSKLSEEAQRIRETILENIKVLSDDTSTSGYEKSLIFFRAAAKEHDDPLAHFLLGCFEKKEKSQETEFSHMQTAISHVDKSWTESLLHLWDDDQDWFSLALLDMLVTHCPTEKLTIAFGCKLIEKGRHDQGFELLTKYPNNFDAQTLLAEGYLRGWGGAVDVQKAVEHLRKFCTFFKDPILDDKLFNSLPVDRLALLRLLGSWFEKSELLLWKKLAEEYGSDIPLYQFLYKLHDTLQRVKEVEVGSKPSKQADNINTFLNSLKKNLTSYTHDLLGNPHCSNDSIDDEEWELLAEEMKRARMVLKNELPQSVQSDLSSILNLLYILHPKLQQEDSCDLHQPNACAAKLFDLPLLYELACYIAGVKAGCFPSDSLPFFRRAVELGEEQAIIQLSLYHWKIEGALALLKEIAGEEHTMAMNAIKNILLLINPSHFSRHLMIKHLYLFE